MKIKIEIWNDKDELITFFESENANEIINEIQQAIAFQLDINKICQEH